jgi:uncharacterized membrane protein
LIELTATIRHNKHKMTTDEKPTKETLERWKHNPNNWKWGIVYYNKEDKNQITQWIKK